MRSVSLAIDAIKHDDKAEAVRACCVFEHPGELDSQLRHRLTPRWCGIPCEGTGYLADDALVKMAGCDAFYRVDDGILETEAAIFGLICQGGQQSCCDGTLARGLSAV